MPRAARSRTAAIYCRKDHRNVNQNRRQCLSALGPESLTVSGTKLIRGRIKTRERSMDYNGSIVSTRVKLTELSLPFFARVATISTVSSVRVTSTTSFLSDMRSSIKGILFFFYRISVTLQKASLSYGCLDVQVQKGKSKSQRCSHNLHIQGFKFGRIVGVLIDRRRKNM